jgi:MraZ protein
MVEELYIGQATNRIDAKGRVSVPPDYRRVLEAEPRPVFYLIPSLYGEPCIEGMGDRRYRTIARALDSMDPADPRTRALKSKFIGKCHRAQVEDTGRISLGRDMRTLLGDPGELVFVGHGQTFQIWNPAVFAAHEADADRLAAESVGLIPRYVPPLAAGGEEA